MQSFVHPPSTCAVSVIIPMYNAAKFMPQTLASLFWQTMTDFEVVIIDDCSTDNSVEVVEKFASPLLAAGIKIHILELSENSGTPGLPRNVGIDFAHGKYIAFLDADDMFTPTALEELLTLAENFHVDVINMTNFYVFADSDENPVKLEDLLNIRYKIISCQKTNKPLLKTATEAPNDLAERVKLWVNDDIHWATCGLFCRRDFLLKNKIKFPDLLLCEDQLVQFECLCFAEKFLRVPNITYIVRKNSSSVSRQKMSPKKFLHKWVSSLKNGFNEFDSIMCRIPFFVEHAEYRYAVLNWFFGRVLTDAAAVWNIYENFSLPEIMSFLLKEFPLDTALFTAYLFNTVNYQQHQIAYLQMELQKFYVRKI